MDEEPPSPTRVSLDGDKNVKEVEDVHVKYNEGRWSAEEHNRFLSALRELETKGEEVEKWHYITNAVGTRSTLQCRSHSQKYFLKLKRRHDKEQKEKHQIVQTQQIWLHPTMPPPYYLQQLQQPHYWPSSPQPPNLQTYAPHPYDIYAVPRTTPQPGYPIFPQPQQPILNAGEGSSPLIYPHSPTMWPFYQPLPSQKP